MSINRIRDKLWFIYILEYYSSIKRNKLLTHITVWINLKNIILSERNLIQKNIYCMIPFISSSRIERAKRGWKNQNCGYFWEIGWELTERRHERTFCSCGIVIYLDRRLVIISTFSKFMVHLHKIECTLNICTLHYMYILPQKKKL